MPRYVPLYAKLQSGHCAVLFLQLLCLMFPSVHASKSLATFSLLSCYCCLFSFFPSFPIFFCLFLHLFASKIVDQSSRWYCQYLPQPPLLPPTTRGLDQLLTPLSHSLFQSKTNLLAQVLVFELLQVYMPNSYISVKRTIGASSNSHTAHAQAALGK